MGTGIFERGEGNETRKKRLDQLGKGAGVFVYDGKGVDTEWIPTALKTSGKQALLDGDGAPVMDAAGRQVFEPKGQIVRDDKGNIVLGGPPKVVKHAIKTMKLRGVEFPAGKPVEVLDKALALKLRCLAHFDELAGEDLAKFKKKGAAPVA
jgi:hypothetical protein